MWYSGGFLVLVIDINLCNCMQTRQHMIDGKKVEAKAAVPRNSGSGNSLTKKMFVGGTVRLSLASLSAHTVAISAQQPHGCHLCENTLTHCERLLQGDIADEEFSQYFSQFGDIEDCVVSLCNATTCAHCDHPLPALSHGV